MYNYVINDMYKWICMIAMYIRMYTIKFNLLKHENNRQVIVKKD